MEELEKLKEWLLEERDFMVFLFIEYLEEKNEFERGVLKGKYLMIDEVCEYIRRKLKYGE